jgi:hypothetical protein
LESAHWAVSWREGDIELISHVDRGCTMGVGAPRVQEKTLRTAKLVRTTSLSLDRVTP